MTASRLLPLARDYLVLTAGSVIVAAAVNLFLVPHNVVAGGVTGAAIVLRSLVGTPVGLVILAVNVPLYLLGLKYLGGVTFGIRTAYATIVLAVAVDALAPLGGRLDLKDPLIYTLYGGLLEGLGLGLVFRARGTTGGIDIIARLIQRRFRVRLGQAMLALDALIFAGAGLVFGATPVLYALLVSYISSRTIVVVTEGVNVARSAVIVTTQPEAIRAAVLSDLARGITTLEGRGGYTSEGRQVLLCVVARSEESFLKDLIGRIDPGAFVVITEAAEVLGQGWTPFDPRRPSGG